jgi:hypothetical protein
MVRCGGAIIPSISRVQAAGAPSPDSFADVSRCTTRESSRTVVFQWVVQGIGYPMCRVGLDARSEGRVKTAYKRFVGCWPRRCWSTWRQVTGASLGPLKQPSN